MFVTKNNIKCVWLLILIFFICSFANARQIRYSRYNTEVIENVQDSQDSGKNIIVYNNQTLDSKNEIQATVREIKYAANSNRSMRAYPLPSDALAQKESSEIEAQVTDDTLTAATTEITEEYESETTTVSNVEDVNNLNENDSAKPNAPYPAVGFKPKVPFFLPTDNFQQKVDTAELTEQSNESITEMPIEADKKAPYPAAGYRPSKAFLLPSEQLLLENAKEDVGLKPKMVNSNHPPCGSSTDPLAPKPLDGEKEDPNSESIFVNTHEKHAIALPVRYSVKPLLLTRPLIYSTPIITAW